MKARPDLLHADSPPGLEVFQLTHEERVPGSHIYMEAQIFTPDSHRLVLHRSAHPHGSDPQDPEHSYLVCDLASGELTPVTEELGATAPSVTPDGQTLYYFVNQTVPGGGSLTLKKVGLDGAGRETVMVVDGPLPDSGFRVSRPYPLSTISADGNRLALSCFLGDGHSPAAPWGLLVFDLQAPSVALVVHGPSWCNMHPQYCRATGAEAMRDILIQENHGNECRPDGTCIRLTGGHGADIHVIRDDGSAMRVMPWGRDGNEFCQGHQCWIGRTVRAITSTGTREPPSARLIAGRPVSHAGHLGLETPGGWRNDLTRELPAPDFYHFATDIEGRWLITDSGPREQGGGVWLAELPAEAEAPLRNMTFLLNPRSSWDKGAHIHPFLAPDGRTGFFNSDESGILQAYMVRGW